MGTEFAKVLVKLRQEAKLTRYALAREAKVDPTYLGRLERGEARHPTKEYVLKLGQALLDNSAKISLEDIDRLLKAAGHAPLRRERISILPSK